MQRSASMMAAAAVLVVGAALALAALGSGGGFSYDDPFEPLPLPAPQGRGSEVGSAADRTRRLPGFLVFVTRDVQRFWAGVFERRGWEYAPARLVVFDDRVVSRCGLASAKTGPFYCALDRSVYLDLEFFRELAVEFRAPGDFAQAYVVAHELAHHVQNLLGIMAQVQEAILERVAPPNVLSIRLELQADCLAGVWAHSTYERGLLERGDLAEGLRAAAAVGDDRIQARTTGRIEPEEWTHGSSEQRRWWFVRGFESGDADDCDTFSGAV
jgi:predicted metalloprotease